MAPSPEPSSPEFEFEPELGPLPTAAHTEDINRRWRGLGVGVDNGLWGSSYAQSFKVDVPFGWRAGQFLGMRIRRTVVHAQIDGHWDGVINTGLELFGRSPVWFGLLRTYGGGGAWLGLRPALIDPGRGADLWGIGGGGHFGVEFLLVPWASLQIEIGGQSAAHRLGVDAGASVMAGVMFYTGRAQEQ